tara:strand:+ start:129 stop:1010 length:882 start_codon:yes stop_codon:yes gene_type:complete
MSSIPRLNADKIVVGGNDVSQPIGESDKTPTGTAILNGPVVCGKVNKTQNNYEGVLNVSSDSAPQISLDSSPKLNVNLAAKVDGNMTVEGDSKTSNALLISGGSSVDTVHIIGDLFVSGSIDGDNKGRLATRFSTADSLGKSFDLKHPTKDGHRLRYACVEGPEIGVYYRGRLKGSNIIELPEYWKNLVYEDSITVQLQPIGKNQNLVIESFNSEYVVIEVGNNIDLFTDEILIDCFYHVYGERKDVNPLITEYEGDSWKDYPDPNWKLGPYNKDRNLKDPQYNYGQNVTTND